MIRMLTICFAAALAVQARGAVTDAEATRIALANAGITEAAPQALYVGPDTVNGTLVYEVRFHDHGHRHIYLIDAATGEIVRSEHKRLPALDAEGQQTDIGGTQARTLALDDAGAGDSAADVRVDRSYREGVFFYVVTFRVGAVCHRYHVDAATGNILSRSTDSRD